MQALDEMDGNGSVFYLNNPLTLLAKSNIYLTAGLSAASLLGAGIAINEIDASEESSAISIVKAPSITEPFANDTANGYWTDCAAEGQTCNLPSGARARVRYGANGRFVYRDVTDAIGCANGIFGEDPVPYVVKACSFEKSNASEYWVNCASEGEICRLPSGVRARVRYGAAGTFVYRDVTAAVGCTNAAFGEDPVPYVVKGCAYVSSTPQPSIPAGNPTAARDRLGVNVAQINYWSNEPTFANQAVGLTWLDNWQAVPKERLRPDGMPLIVERGKALQGFLMPPVTAYTGGDTTTVCTWKGKGELYADGDWSRPTAQGPQMMEFRWNLGKPPRVWLEIRESVANNPIRDLDCRLKTDPSDALFSRQILDYLKPFGVLRFLDWSTANSNVAARWSNRGRADGIAMVGTDGIALEYQIALANTIGASPWFTVSWNADDDYHRRMAQMVHDTVPAGKPVYIELSNEVWNYDFSQAHQVQAEGLAGKLSNNGFQANIYRYAQKITQVMPIWTEVFKDRPKDLVRVAATQSANPWVGGEMMAWNNEAVAPYIDAIAIAPYFKVDANKLTDNHAGNMAALAAAAKERITKDTVAYKALADKFGKRLISYEGGQHQLDPGRLDRMQAMNRDLVMENIYRQYLTDWNATTGDLFTLYSATGSISQFGAWGLREYAGQPLSETPKLRGVINYTK